VPRNAARALRYMDRFVTVTQGDVFFATELLARAEGLERGPAGNTSLAAALHVARELPDDQLVVVSETEYTGAGKSPVAQLEFAETMGVEVGVGSPSSSIPGKSILLPTAIGDVIVRDVDLDRLRRSYLQRLSATLKRGLDDDELAFVAEDLGVSVPDTRRLIDGR
jgi:hypothetical protein